MTSINILTVRKIYFDKLVNVHPGEKKKKPEEFQIHTAEPWKPGPTEIQVEISINK